VFRTLTISGDASALREGPAAAVPPRDGEVRWIDLEDFADDEIAAGAFWLASARGRGVPAAGAARQG
jgi:hypothetical protein